jgi:hypothetical protein
VENRGKIYGSRSFMPGKALSCGLYLNKGLHEAALYIVSLYWNVVSP